ncbi:MAG: UDP-2,3-diacylglucosamine diphosphatase [Burkholderiales bacterium]|nr:UDP-2,3-diacylglucosamine diphosphatase [Burkholderiales bacterium]
MTHVRSIFLSDVHLGTRACQAERLLEFLAEHSCDNLFLVGDIVDFWAMRRSMYWSAAQNTVVQKILKRARHGVRVIFVPGNHDEIAREHVGASFGNIRVERELVHTAADGRRYLLVHGDEFDQVTKYHRWIAVLGDRAYGLVVRLNRILSKARCALGIAGHWSLSGYVKTKVKGAVNFIFDYEEAVMRHARERRVDGVICGHIHAAVVRESDHLVYINCGDWVDNCTAILEHADGRMELVRWLGRVAAAERAPAVAAPAVLARALPDPPADGVPPATGRIGARPAARRAA